MTRYMRAALLAAVGGLAAVGCTGSRPGVQARYQEYADGHWPNRYQGATREAVLHPHETQMRNALMAVAGLTFVFAFGELGTAVLVTPPGLMTLPVHVYTVVANAPPGELARLALVQAAAGLAGVVLLARVSLGRPA